MNKLVRKENKNNKGFSLVELIVVIAIMAVLVGIIAPQFLGYTAKAKISTDVQNAQQVATELSVNIADDTITSPAVTETTAGDPTTVAWVKLDGVVNTNPSPKATTGTIFVYTLDSDGNIQVGVGAEGAIANAKILYPIADTSYGK